MATLKGTGAVEGAQPRSVHAGVNSVISTYISTATGSAGDVIQMVKIPDGAKMLNVRVKANSGANALVSVGDGGNNARYLATATVSDAIRAMDVAAAMGYQYDLSDGAIPLHDTVDIRLANSAAASTTYTLVAEYEVGT